MRNRLRAALVGLVLLLSTCAGCAGVSYADATYIPPGTDPKPTTAVLTAASRAATLHTDDGLCTVAPITGARALTDRHCYAFPEHTGTLGHVRAPGTTNTIPVLSGAQWDLQRDAVVLHLEAQLPTLPIAAEEPAPGDPVWAVGMGCMMGYAPMVHAGVVVGYRAKDIIARVGVGVCPGDSGGPLLNARGEVVGLVGGYASQDRKLIYSASVAGVVP